METRAPKARCVHCRSDVAVPETYAHGDHIKCPACGTRHRVSRGDALRLVLADVAPLKEALQANQALVERLEADRRATTLSFGLGANGFAVGFAFVLWQVALQGQPLDGELFGQAFGVAVGTAIVLELANYLFLSKRRRLMRLTEEIAEARADGAQLQQKIREAARV